MDPLPIFVTGLMIGSVGSLLAQAYGRRRMTRTFQRNAHGSRGRD